MSRLTPKQRKFCDYYIETGNATESAIRAGYSKNCATEMGHENLRKPHIVDYIEGRNKEIENKRIADMKEIKEFWTGVVRDQDVEMKDRLKASEFVAKTNAAFIDRVETTEDIEVVVTVEDDED
jgi:phage terminase small subunit